MRPIWKEVRLESDTGRSCFDLVLKGCGLNDFASVGEDEGGWWYEMCVGNLHFDADYNRYERHEAEDILLRKLGENGIEYEEE